MLSLAASHNVQNFLKKSNLSQYFESFCDQRYDDPGQILSFANDHAELHCLMGDVGLSKKSGHIKRFLAAIKLEASMLNHGEPQKAEQYQEHNTNPSNTADPSKCKLFFNS